jgi:8-oxo-dGTP pyrophosphatase MutT (NUDIX family)
VTDRAREAESAHSPERPPGWLPKAEFDYIYSRVTRMCVEIVVVDPDRGVLLALREIPPNVGAWHIPGGTILFAETVLGAVRRIALDEIGMDVSVGELLGYIEYPSHYLNGLDSPIGLAFSCSLVPGSGALDQTCKWFRELPEGLYGEQRTFLTERLGFS